MTNNIDKDNMFKAISDFPDNIIDAINLYKKFKNLNKIKPNTIVEFARLYGFQVDFQRDIWKNDTFQIIFEEFKNEDDLVIETGNIIYANFLNNFLTKSTLIYLYKEIMINS